jgi:hypothetical protein
MVLKRQLLARGADPRLKNQQDLTALVLLNKVNARTPLRLVSHCGRAVPVHRQLGNRYGGRRIVRIESSIRIS